VKNNNIEELVKNALEQFEPEVPSHLWENIQSQIAVNPSGGQSSASDGGASAASGWASGATLLKVAATAVLISGGVYLGYNALQTDDNKNASAQVEPVVSDEITESAQIEKDEVDAPEMQSELEDAAVVEAIETESMQENSNAVGDIRNIAVEEDAELEESVEEVLIDNNNVESSTNAEKTVNNSPKNSTTNKTAKPNPVKNNKPNSEVTIVEAGILANKVNGEIPLTITFNNITNAQYFEWDFGNGIKSFDASPSVTFEEDGDYTVKLTITDFNGNQLSDRMEINAYLPSTLFVPNAFSPNGDGENDYFGVEGENVSNVNFKVLRLDGSTVFEGRTMLDRWDGVDSQSPNADKYMIVATAIGSNGKPIARNAFLQVFRDGNR
jgi:hypothetical protein